MSMNSVLKDKVTLVKKKDKTSVKDIRASVQGNKNKIYTADPNIRIEDGDVFEHILHNGVVERYLILDIGYTSDGSGKFHHYESKVQKITTTD